MVSRVSLALAQRKMLGPPLRSNELANRQPATSTTVDLYWHGEGKIEDLSTRLETINK